VMCSTRSSTDVVERTSHESTSDEKTIRDRPS
jgi:hypothetical protein